jgi:hypothetical protein
MTHEARPEIRRDDKEKLNPLDPSRRRLHREMSLRDHQVRWAGTIMRNNRSLDLALRVREIRHDMFGENGGPLLAERLRLPLQTWLEFEGGRMIPVEVILRFVELTHANPDWLLTGTGDKYHRNDRAGGSRGQGQFRDR